MTKQDRKHVEKALAELRTAYRTHPEGRVHYIAIAAKLKGMLDA